MRWGREVGARSPKGFESPVKMFEYLSWAMGKH